MKVSRFRMSECSAETPLMEWLKMMDRLAMRTWPSHRMAVLRRTSVQEPSSGESFSDRPSR